MKKMVKCILVLVLCLAIAPAYAAQWSEGRSAAQPYAGVPEVKLDQTMGYMIFYPSARMPAERFCDSLTIYFPREDIALGKGTLRLMDGTEEVLALNCADDRIVTIHSMTEGELDGLMWGGGTAAVFHLPISLELGKEYGVELDQGAVAVQRGRVVSPPVHGVKQWAPKLEGEYGVSKLYYMGGEYVDEEGILQSAPLRDWPRSGDTVHLTIALGGEAKRAVIYDPAGTMTFDRMEYTETTEVTGTVGDEMGDWGVIFQDEAGEVLNVVEINPVGEAAP